MPLVKWHKSNSLLATTNNNHFEYLCRYGTRVDYVYCNENLRMDWMPVAVEHYEEDISDHKAVIATLIKKTGI